MTPEHDYFIREVAALPAEAKDLLPHQELAGRTWVLAGASGFVGRWVLGAIGWLNAQQTEAPILVRAFSRRGGSAIGDWCHWDQADVRRPPSLEGASGVLHAALSSTATPPGAEAERTSIAVEGTRALVRAAVVADVSRFLLLSSGAVYATANKPVSEYFSLNSAPTDPYAEAKQAAEVEATTGIRESSTTLCMARLFTTYGAGYDAHDHLAHQVLLQQAQLGQPFVLSGDGSPVRSYLYGADLAVWLLRLLTKGEGVVNVGSNRAYSVREFAHRLASVCGHDPSAVRFCGSAPKRRIYLPNTERASTLHGLSSWTPLDRGLLRAYMAGT